MSDHTDRHDGSYAHVNSITCMQSIQPLMQATYCIRPNSRAECFLTNGSEPGTKFTPHLLISYHMKEQDHSTL